MGSSGAGVGRSRRLSAALAVGALALGCCGCQSSQEKSAQLAKRAKHARLAVQGVSVTKQSSKVKVVATTLLRSGEGAAVVVELRNTSSRPIENAPIEIAVLDSRGSTLFKNGRPGEDPSLRRVSLLRPGQEAVWVDDQVQASGVPARASALVGEGTQASGGVPELSASATHALSEAGVGGGVAGTVANRSSIGQQHLVVYAMARDGSRIVAAGRAVLQEVPAGASAPFQIYFTGNPHGAHIQTSAPATTF